MRTGPLVRRNANVSRIAQAAPATFRVSTPPRTLKQPPSIAKFPFPIAAPIQSSCPHLECRLPINLRNFLAEQLGAKLEAGDQTIVDLAASADEATLSRLARAIRRYSTARAHEAWADCAVSLARFAGSGRNASRGAVLCLKCTTVEFGDNATEAHQAPACLPVNLEAACATAEDGSTRSHQAIADRVQRLIEEFRALRVAFGLPHFELDCYVSNRRLTFTWRPLP